MRNSTWLLSKSPRRQWEFSTKLSSQNTANPEPSSSYVEPRGSCRALGETRYSSEEYLIRQARSRAGSARKYRSHTRLLRRLARSAAPPRKSIGEGRNLEKSVSYSPRNIRVMRKQFGRR